MVETVKSWCILRTMAQQTLVLAAALDKCGYISWTPRETRILRARRSIPQREIITALMPGVVFADFDRISDLIALRRSAMTYQVWDADRRRMMSRGVPYFHLMQVGERYARIGDPALAGIRAAEGARAVATKRATFRIGQDVRCGDGLLDGIRGKIIALRGDFAEIEVIGWTHPMAMALTLLDSVDG